MTDRPEPGDAPRRPRFTIVSAVHDVEPYLPEFIASVEALRIAPHDLEVIAVDDGSTDGSLDLLRQWGGRSRYRVHVFTKPNTGQGAARNLGLEHATGEWVTFSDPDDVLDPDFLHVAARFADRHPDVELMAGKPIVLLEAEGRIADIHPRRLQYRAGNRVVNLLDEPNVFGGSPTLGFLRLDRIRALGLRFDPRIRPNFEDGHFAVHYVLSLEVPRVGILRDARYYYRRRSEGTSTSQRSLAHPGRFTDVLEHGYLDVLAAGLARSKGIPEWLQHVVIYELSWYLSADDKITSDIVLPDELAPRLHELLGRIVRQLDPVVIAAHRARQLRPVWVDVLAHAYRDTPWHSSHVTRDEVDREMGLQRITYRYTGVQPDESFLVDGEPTAPAFAKTRAQRYYGRTVLRERVLWLPIGELHAALDGVALPVRVHRRHRPHRPGPSLAERIPVYRRLPRRYVVGAILRRLRRVARRAAAPVVRLASRLPRYEPFRDAWVVMDRVHNADDNGQRLFEHLRATRPDINAWFVVARDSPDWAQLEAAGTGRLVAWGSWRWRMLLVNCRWLVSSHADRALAEPRGVVRLARSHRWKFAFLQHGVIKDDLSLWLNHRDIDLFVVSTEAELESVAGDETSYTVTHKETRLTGLPRFDRLLAKGRAVPPDERDLVIVAPTWRTWLTLPIERATQRRDVHDVFWDSDYYRSWIGVLRSPVIAAAAARRGWRIGFMPHPNIQPILRRMELPDHVESVSFAGSDVQGLYARCGLLVTDYSSVAFNLAYLDRPVVYFQFDLAEMLRGAHMGRQGYFDYRRDGFGPVAEDLESAEREIVASIERGAAPAPVYQSRIDRTFVVRDGGACARVVAAIEELSRPYEAPDR